MRSEDRQDDGLAKSVVANRARPSTGKPVTKLSSVSPPVTSNGARQQRAFSNANANQ